MPRVSVIVPTFNCARYLSRALDSALAQTFRDYEILVVDDGSTDETRELVDRYGGKVRYFYQANGGLSSARNLALSKASGEFIAYLDADDMWYPQKLETQVEFLDRNQDCGLVHSDVTVIDEMDQVIYFQVNKERGREVPQGGSMRALLQENHVLILTVLERRDCIERVGTFDERLKETQDYLHWMLLAMEGIPFGYIPEPLAKYRWRRDNLSGNPRRTQEDLQGAFGILLSEKSLDLRCGQESVGIVRERLYAIQRCLAYLDRVEGQIDHARRRIFNLIREWPLRAELYVELVKACVPPNMASKIRSLKGRWRSHLASQSL